MIHGSYTTRLATEADAAAIAEIYNQGIEDGIATFETAPRSAADIVALMREKGDRYPTVVVEHEGRIVAWAGASSYRARAAYVGVADHSVYVDRAWRGRGAGHAALDALVPEYERRGFWKLSSRIFADNTASVALHERCGFRVVGVYRRHGRLRGVWKDCVVVERLIGEAAERTEHTEETASQRIPLSPSPPFPRSGAFMKNARTDLTAVGASEHSLPPRR